MLFDLLKEFVLELARALLLEGLCQRVKEEIVSMFARRLLHRRRAFHCWLRSRPSRQLLHRLTTGANKKL